MRICKSRRDYPYAFLCDCCQQTSPITCCICRNWTLLCNTCFSSHIANRPNLIHCGIPIESYLDIKENSDRYRMLVEKSAELVLSLTRAGYCCQEVTATVDAMIDRRNIQRGEIEANAKKALRLQQLGSREGDSKLDEGTYTEAIQAFAEAHAIFSRFFPQNILDPFSFHSREEPEALTEAATKYAAACTVCSHLFPDDIRIPQSLSNLGFALDIMCKRKEAMILYVAAGAIFSSTFSDDISTANNLANWGFLLYSERMYAEAVVKFAEADTIYSRLFLYDINTAHNLWNWGYALKKMQKSAEALENFEAARATYACQEITDLRDYRLRVCDRQIANLRKKATFL